MIQFSQYLLGTTSNIFMNYKKYFYKQYFLRSTSSRQNIFCEPLTSSTTEDTLKHKLVTDREVGGEGKAKVDDQTSHSNANFICSQIIWTNVKRTYQILYTATNQYSCLNANLSAKLAGTCTEACLQQKFTWAVKKVKFHVLYFIYVENVLRQGVKGTFNKYLLHEESVHLILIVQDFQLSLLISKPFTFNL